MLEQSFAQFLSPLKVGGVTLPNRAVMGSMHTRLDHLDDGVARLAAFYAERARGGVGLIVTGGYAPNEEARLDPQGPILASEKDAEQQSVIADAVHDAGGLVLLQILHPGRYAKHEQAVGASDNRAPINRFAPRALSTEDVWRTIDAFVRCAELAKLAGFDGVEIMGSEGYLLNQFLASRTNNRTDEFGGPLENRIRFAVEATQRIRAALGDDFVIMYRASVLDLVEGGLTGAEIRALGRAVEAAGADALNSGIGWHEARVPTIANMVPRGAWRFATRNLKDAVDVPVMASNRINTPALAEEILAAGDADLISLARPMLADAFFVDKAATGRADEINVCIGCNQACLDHIFSGRVATCLVNPRACRETEFALTPVRGKKRIAVIGGGPAGLAYATNAAERGHDVALYEAAGRVGGQMQLARVVPGKADFNDLIAYFEKRLAVTGVALHLNAAPSADEIAAAGYDHVAIATGVVPRVPEIPGIDHPMVATYADILTGAVEAGERVAIIGAGGIGFDVAEFLSAESPADEAEELRWFLDEWNVDRTIEAPGGLLPGRPKPTPSRRRIYLLQRKPTPPGKDLGVSTGWILRATLKARGVEMIPGVRYERIDDHGLHVTIQDEAKQLAVDTIVACAGQEPDRRLFDALKARGIEATLLGGAERAEELDAVRAIDMGTRLALAV
jgi:2,4-dienoyl-CoA reductase (NADPH2)